MDDRIYFCLLFSISWLLFSLKKKITWGYVSCFQFINRKRNVEIENNLFLETVLFFAGEKGLINFTKKKYFNPKKKNYVEWKIS